MKRTTEKQIANLTMKLLKAEEKKEAAWLSYSKKLTTMQRANEKYIKSIRETNKLRESLKAKQASLKNS